MGDKAYTFALSLVMGGAPNRLDAPAIFRTILHSC